jgi:molybdopterin converting factor small subunit
MGRNLDMVIKIKYFGLIANNSISEVVLPEGSDINVLINHLINEEPRNKDILNKATFLVNKSKASTSTILNDKDEIMILTVLGGG